MRLLQIQPLPRSGKIRLIFDDDTALTTQPYVTADLGLYAGLELTESEMDELRQAVHRASAKERAVRIISASGVSEKELQKRLEQKGEDAQDAGEAVAWLKDLHLLDDRQTAAQIVASAVRKGYGRSRIKNLLFEKGIPAKFWEEALEGIPDQSDAIDRFLAQKLAGRDADEKAVKKAVDALLRRGHSWNDIQNALRRYQSDSEIIPEFDPDDF